jgi:hypothetical protein
MYTRMLQFGHGFGRNVIPSGYACVEKVSGVSDVSKKLLKGWSEDQCDYH